MVSLMIFSLTLGAKNSFYIFEMVTFREKLARSIDRTRNQDDKLDEKFVMILSLQFQLLLK